MYIPKRNLKINGPFEVTFGVAASVAVGATMIPKSQFGGSDPEQTPAPSIAFEDISKRDGHDPGLAVGPKHVLVCDQKSGIAVYGKTGALLALPGQNPIKTETLFSQVAADIEAHKTVPTGLPAGFKFSPIYGDLRIMFDPYRQRFWVYAQHKNNPGVTPSNVLNEAVRMTKRNQAAVAVSKTANPSDGFYTYWWHETIDNGECNTAAGCDDPDFKKSGEGSDYPTLGISPKYFIASVGVNRRDPTYTVPGDTTGDATYTDGWVGCKTGFTTFDGHDFCWCGPFYAHVMVIDADALALGKPFNPGDHIITKVGSKPPPFSGRSFAIFVRADNWLTDRTQEGDFACASSMSVRPVVMHNPPPPAAVPGLEPTTMKAEAFLANLFIDRKPFSQTSSLIARRGSRPSAPSSCGPSLAMT